MVSEVKESSDDLWTIFDLFQGLSEQFVQVLCIYFENSAFFKDILNNSNKFYAVSSDIWQFSTYFKDITVVQSFFFSKRGDTWV